jgi:hypothetical protein
MILGVTEAVLQSIRCSLLLGSCDQSLNIAIVCHFQIDADSTVKRAVWKHDVQVVNTALDDLCKNLVGSLIMSDPNSYSMLGVEQGFDWFW